MPSIIDELIEHAIACKSREIKVMHAEQAMRVVSEAGGTMQFKTATQKVTLQI
jgi:hypothetical protein